MRYSQKTLDKFSTRESSILTFKIRAAEKLINKVECFNCHAKQNLEYHHKDGHRENNKLDNFVVLCRTCHIKAHKELYKQYCKGEITLFK